MDQQIIDRVTRFCDEWARPTTQYNPEVIYTLGRIDGDHSLLTSDLRALLAEVTR